MAMPQPKLDQRTRIRNPRSARTATQTRIVKTTRARYRGIVQILVGLGITLILLMAYVMLLSNATSLSYTLDKAHRQRDELQELTARLDGRIAQAESEERLAAIATKLKMRDPQTFALVRLDQETVAKSKIPVVDAILAWF